MKKKYSYLALTIGPIVKTLLNTRKTRELWGASYLFSRIMRDIIYELLQSGAIKESDIVLPSLHLFERKNDSLSLNVPSSITIDGLDLRRMGAGLFPDRLYVKLENGQEKNILQKTEQAANRVLEELARMMDPIVEDNSLPYLKQYFQIYAILKELPEDGNIIYQLSPLLDTLELQSNFPQIEKSKPLLDFLWEINRSYKLITEAFYKYHRPAHKEFPKIQRFGFDSLVEIAVRELGYITKTQQFFSQSLRQYLKSIGVLKNTNKKSPTRQKEFLEEKKFLEQLYSTKPTQSYFRTYHKYVAIVTADGDNMGSILKQIGNDAEKVRQFSKQLTDFAARAVLLIHRYGGAPVYAGGDDLLFFAPVSMVQARSSKAQEGYHILHLLEILDREFKNAMKDYEAHNPSLSFGVSITYYAFPMGESLEQSRNLLSDIAKKIKGKNVVALTIQKHSGNQFGGIYRFGSKSYQYLRHMLCHDPAQDDEIEQLKSVMYKLRNNEGLMEQIGKDETRVRNFMENGFNESIHRDADGNLIPYLQWVSDLIPAVYQEIDEVKEQLEGDTDSEKAMNQLYGMLRTVSFLKGEEL